MGGIILLLFFEPFYLRWKTEVGGFIFDLYKNITAKIAINSENQDLFKAYEILKTCLIFYDPNNKYNFFFFIKFRTER